MFVTLLSLRRPVLVQARLRQAHTVVEFEQVKRECEDTHNRGKG